MPRTVSASQAKTQFGSIIKWAIDAKDNVIIESYGQPKAVIVPFEAYEQMVELQEKARREEALIRLERLRKEVRAGNRDLTEEQADSLADRFSGEVIGEMADEGKISYESQ